MKYGRFHIGDSYIVLSTYVKDPANPNKLSYDAHFWIGSVSTRGSTARRRTRRWSSTTT